MVGMRIPPAQFANFAKEYFALFDASGNRPDQAGDRGPEYRNLVGVPGGADSPLGRALVEASVAAGDRLDLARGRGGAGDVGGRGDGDARAVVWVLDTAEFPFLVGEPYHQHHDGFASGEDYPGSYNSLGQKRLKAGGFLDSGCPQGMLGLGFAGL